MTPPAAAPPVAGAELAAAATTTLVEEAMKGEPTKLTAAGALVEKAEGDRCSAEATDCVMAVCSEASCGDAPASALCMVMVCCSVGVLPSATTTLTLTPRLPGAPAPRRRAFATGVAATTAPVAKSVKFATETSAAGTASSCA